MSDTNGTTIDHDANEHPEADQQPEAQTTVAEALPENEPTTPLRTRAEMVPVSQGAAPTNLGQQIDFAQYMARADFAVPPHLRRNPGACLAVLDISTRAGLSPFMVANKTYVQNDRLCFESQLFHAFLTQSGLLVGDLDVEYEGEGLERTCTITGILKSDRKPRRHTSPPLGKLHPGYSTKNRDGKELKFVKGSPLWDKKPDVQLFYDTSRDWTRLYAPTATLGMFTPEEMLETPLGAEGAIEVHEVDSTLHARLQGSNRSEEGHTPGHAAKELANVAAGGKTAKIEPATTKAARSAPVTPKKHTGRAARRAKRTSEPAKAKATPQPKPEKPAAPAKSATQHKAELEQANAPNGLPKTNAEYWPYAIKWIDAPVPPKVTADDHAGNLEARWDGETHLRDELSVPIPRRKEIEKHLITRCKELRAE